MAVPPSPQQRATYPQRRVVWRVLLRPTALLAIPPALLPQSKNQLTQLMLMFMVRIIMITSITITIHALCLVRDMRIRIYEDILPWKRSSKTCVAITKQLMELVIVAMVAAKVILVPRLKIPPLRLQLQITPIAAINIQQNK